VTAPTCITTAPDAELIAVDEPATGDSLPSEPDAVEAVEDDPAQARVIVMAPDADDEVEADPTSMIAPNTPDA
jgi:hypothetical protein